MNKIFFLLIIIPAFAFAQKNASVVSDNTLLLQLINKPDVACANQSVTFDVTQLETDVNKYYQQLTEMQHPLSELRLVNNIKSPIGNHLFYQQYFNGTPVYGAYIKVNINKKGAQLSAYNHLYNSQNWRAQTIAMDATKGELVYVVKDGTIIPAYKKYANGIEFLTDINNAYLFERDLKLNFTVDDTLVNGKVFLPDPITPISKIYGQDGTYQNFNDSDYALLNDQRIDGSFPATFRNDSFYLENKYAIITDIAFPNIAPAVLKEPQFNFTRKADGFKEVMVLYHIANIQKFIQSIGFTNIVNYQLRVDAHSGTSDNSYYTYSPDTSLNFGTGGVPDAEDADVIVHEYTHAISHSINPNGISSNERRAIEEAICDAMAVSYSRNYYTFNWRYFANWDGHNPYWAGRNTESTKTYDNYISSSNYYINSVIWSSTMSDIIEEVGRDLTMELLLTSLYSYTPNTTMPQAAQLFMDADSILYNKANSWRLGKFFVDRKLGNFSTGINDIGNSPTFKLYNTSGFANGTSDALLDLEETSTITVYNLQGQKVYETKESKGTVHLSPANFNSGFYFVTIESEKGMNTVKVTRF